MLTPAWTAVPAVIPAPTALSILLTNYISLKKIPGAEAPGIFLPRRGSAALGDGAQLADLAQDVDAPIRLHMTERFDKRRFALFSLHGPNDAACLHIAYTYRYSNME